MKRLVWIVTLVVGAAALLLPWWRNHAVLQDFYDYGLVMAAAGRIELGERPYVDFVTPIQTLQFLAAVLAEWIWGARYLSLTYLNAVFIALSFAGLSAMLLKRFGAVVALLAAGAIVMASSVQHTIIWYNAMGVTWLAIVLWLTPRLSSQPRGGLGLLAMICAALWVCGMTKLTYLIAALAFATTFTVRAAYFNGIPWPVARRRLWSFFAFGVIAPVATEIAFTGASLAQWLENVVVLPARFRTDMLGRIGTLGFYWHTPHDYYQPLHFTYAGAWGIALLLAVTGLLTAALWPERLGRGARFGFLLMLFAGAWISGAVLLATNMDIAYLSGAAWLVFAIGLVEIAPSVNSGRVGRALRLTVGVAAVSLLFPATVAAWRGTRALWGHAPLVRSALVSTNDLPARFSYIKGMKVFPTFHDSVRDYAVKQDALVASGIPLKAFLFVNATEWMVRAMPEARHAGLPLWIAGGTTISETDAWEMGRRFERDPDIRVIVSYAGWNYWYPGLQKSLDRSFRRSEVGPRVHVYLRRQPLEPVELAINTQSNVYAGDMTFYGDTPELRVATNGLFYLGSAGAHRIDLRRPLYRLSGEMVGELPPNADGRETDVTFRVRALEGDRLSDVIWEENIHIPAGERWVSRKFAVSTGGRAASLLLQTSGGAAGHFGWRHLQIDQSGPLADTKPCPMNSDLPALAMDSLERKTLFATETAAVGELNGFGAELRGDVKDGGPRLLSRGPIEIWFKLTTPAARVAGDFGLRPEAWDKAGARVTVICYKSGRFDVLYRKDLNPRTVPADRAAQHFEIGIPEGLAWVGLVVTPLEREHRDVGDAWWRNVRVW